MSSLNFSSPVLINRYKSFGGNLIPEPGVITVDTAGILTLTEDNSKSILLQKQITELQSIQSFSSWNPLNAKTTARIYVGLNEAFEVTFLSGGSALDGGAHAFNSILSGEDVQTTVQQFKADNASLHDKDLRKHAYDNLHKNYADFIAIAKQAGVYKPMGKSLSGVVSILFPLVIIGVIIWAFIMLRN